MLVVVDVVDVDVVLVFDVVNDVVLLFDVCCC